MSDISQLIRRSSVGHGLAAQKAWREFGLNLREQRKAARVTFGEMSARSGLRIARLSDIELGYDAPCTDAELTVYCKAIDIEKPALPTETL